MKRLLFGSLFAMLVAVVAVATLEAQSTAGWKIRADRSTNASDPDAAGEIEFMAMGGGFHAITPQAGVFWHPSSTASGSYTLKGNFTLMEPSGHNNYYGLVFGGSRRISISSSRRMGPGSSSTAPVMPMCTRSRRRLPATR